MQRLATKYSLSTRQIDQLAGRDLTDEQIAQALKEIGDSKRQRSRGSSQRRKHSSSKKRRQSSSSFERDEALGSESIDNILNSILTGDNSFRRRTLGKDHNEPFALAQQESAGSVPSNGTPNANFSGSRKQNRPSIGSKSRRTDRSDDEDSEMGLHQADAEEQVPESSGHLGLPLPNSLESDLETILETDQESQYMTTARTYAQNLMSTQRSKATGQMSSNNYETKHSKASGARADLLNSNGSNKMGNQLPNPKLDFSHAEVLSQSLMNQSINSLNNSSFVQLDGVLGQLPQSLFGAGEGCRRNDDEEEKQETPPETVRKQVAQRKDAQLGNFISDISPIQ